MVRVNACKMIIDAHQCSVDDGGCKRTLHWFNGDIYVISHVYCSETAANYPINVIGLFEKISDSDDADHLVSLSLSKSQLQSVTSIIKMSLFRHLRYVRVEQNGSCRLTRVGSTSSMGHLFICLMRKSSQ